MAEPLTIRPVAEADFEAWRPLWAGYNRFYGRFDDTALPLWPSPQPHPRAHWQLSALCLARRRSVCGCVCVPLHLTIQTLTMAHMV